MNVREGFAQRFDHRPATGPIVLFVIFFLALALARASSNDKTFRGSDEAGALVVEVAGNDAIFVEGERVPLGGLAARVVARRGDRRVRVRALRPIRVETLLAVAKALRGAGPGEVEVAAPEGARAAPD